MNGDDPDQDTRMHSAARQFVNKNPSGCGNEELQASSASMGAGAQTGTDLVLTDSTPVCDAGNDRSSRTATSEEIGMKKPASASGKEEGGRLSHLSTQIQVPAYPYFYDRYLREHVVGRHLPTGIVGR